MISSRQRVPDTGTEQGVLCSGVTDQRQGRLPPRTAPGINVPTMEWVASAGGAISAMPTLLLILGAYFWLSASVPGKPNLRKLMV